MERDLYTVTECCRLNSISRATLYRLLAAGKLYAVKVGSRTLIPAESVQRWRAGLPVLYPPLYPPESVRLGATPEDGEGRTNPQNARQLGVNDTVSDGQKPQRVRRLFRPYLYEVS